MKDKKMFRRILRYMKPYWLNYTLALVLTGIVVSVSVTAIMLSLTIRLYSRYHTLNLDEIFRKIQKDEEEGE